MVPANFERGLRKLAPPPWWPKDTIKLGKCPTVCTTQQNFLFSITRDFMTLQACRPQYTPGLWNPQCGWSGVFGQNTRRALHCIQA